MSSRNEVLRAAELGEQIPYRLWLPYVAAPPWLQGTWGLRWHEALGLFADAIVQGWRESIRVAWPSTTPNDALDLVGVSNSGGIDRLPDELDGPYRSRLERRWETWEESGRRSGVANRLAEYIGNSPTVTCWDMAAGWTDDNVWSWDRLWIVVDQPHPYTELLIADDLIVDDELIIGVDGLTATQYRVWRRLVHKWRPAHARPVKFYIIFSGIIVSPSTIVADDLIVGGTAEDLPITGPIVADNLYADDSLIVGYFIEPV